MVRRVGGQRAVVPGRRAKGGAKSVTKKIFLKLFRNNSQRLSLVRLGHRHSINQSNRLQLTTIYFPVFLSCIAYIHSGYLYSAPSRNVQKCAARAIEVCLRRKSYIRSFKCLSLDHMRYLGYTDIGVATYTFEPTDMTSLLVNLHYVGLYIKLYIICRSC